MTKYMNKYRSESARAQWWDYGWNGAYFITICTADREHYFGEIKNGKMILSPTGVIADLLWHEIINHSKFVELGGFVVMPNHIHGILILDKPNEFVDNRCCFCRDRACPVPTKTTTIGETKQTIDETEKTIGQNRFQNIGKNTVSSIIGSYKSAVTKHANRLGLKNGWQTRFHDHIIRNDAEYQRISNYIVNNPNKWFEDKFHSIQNE
jgi:REP element-mobilizing transposase RayT